MLCSISVPELVRTSHPSLGGDVGNCARTPLNFLAKRTHFDAICLRQHTSILFMPEPDSSRRVSISQTLWLVALLLGSVSLLGCESMKNLGEGLGGMGDKALETIGFKKPELPRSPELPEAVKPARSMKLRFTASESLNVDMAGRSLSLVIRVYKLRGTTAFLNAPYEAFGNSSREKQLLGDELIDSRELLLLPNQQQEISERWARDATHVGVVALFRAPASQRWRYAFELESATFHEGFVLGAHACALSVASGQPAGISAVAMKFHPTACAVN
jgi:type VI secretion system protein VasD